MGLMTALARAVPAGTVEKSLGIPVGGTIPTLGSIPSSSGLMIGQATAMQVAAVYACVRIRARDVSRCAPSLIKEDAVGNKTIVTNHELVDLFRRPNRVQSWFEFCEQMNISLLLRENAYAVKLRDGRGKVKELIPLNPDLVTVLEAPNGSLFYNVSRAGLWLLAVLGGLPIAVPDYDVFHIRGMTFNSLVGIARIGLARDAIGLALAQEQQAGRWAGNGARPAGLLKSPKKLNQESADRLKAQWEKLQAGVQNAGRTAVLEDGVEWVPMQLTSVDMEFIASRGLSTKDIARFFDVPLHKIGEMGDVPKATIAELNSNYVQSTVMGDVTRWESRFDFDWKLSDADLRVRMDETDLLRADPLTMMNFARFGVTSSLMSQNEGRRAIDLPPMTGKETGPDALLTPTNLASHGSDVDGQAPDAAGRPEDGSPPDPKVQGNDNAND